MLTSPPYRPGLPPAYGRHVGSFIDSLIREGRFVGMVGELVEMEADALGRLPADLAEWLGVILIRWAEQDRAEMRADIAAAPAAAAAKRP